MKILWKFWMHWIFDVARKVHIQKRTKFVVYSTRTQINTIAQLGWVHMSLSIHTLDVNSTIAQGSGRRAWWCWTWKKIWYWCGSGGRGLVGEHDAVAARVGRHTLDVLASWIILQLESGHTSPPTAASGSPSGVALAIFHHQDIQLFRRWTKLH
jgi:hypothetical protein